MKCFALRMTRFRRRSCLIVVTVLMLAFINLLLCAWKWQDKEFELNGFELTFLKKRISQFNQKPFTKVVWQSKANPGVLHHSTLQRSRTKRRRPKLTQKAIHYSTVWDRRENHTSPVYQTILRKVRKEDRVPLTKEYKQFIARTGRPPVQKGIISKVRKLLVMVKEQSGA